MLLITGDVFQDKSDMIGGLMILAGIVMLLVPLFRSQDLIRLAKGLMRMFGSGGINKFGSVVSDEVETRNGKVVV